MSNKMNNIKSLSESIAENISQNFSGNVDDEQLRKTIACVLKNGEKYGTIKKYRGRYSMEPNAANSLKITGLFLTELGSRCGPCDMKPKRKVRKSRSRSSSKCGCKPARKMQKKKANRSRTRSADCKPKMSKRKVSKRSKAIKKSNRSSRPKRPSRKPKKCIDGCDTDYD
ncbi:hypothetical protein LSTR_LSTR015038 [Laodelphax striatellus]|uniref:H15 domain-containing protein n=1 Tax=Laodelphax striatellus TaxID=195883 RepID=A0A482WKG8_LAOST|nr:hypothetical protein LSTR_LSTR008011 [Laodelphax striatellus]RZF37616.1 hypothetical protein LSTR_LSTR015038 [Laodelphax striatellus]